MNRVMASALDFVNAHAGVLPIALACGAALTAVSVSLLAWVRARALTLQLERRHAERAGVTEDTITSLQSSLAALTAQLDELRRTPAVAPPFSLRPTFNLSKRSQALRMHRHGDLPEQIASALEVPKQEVDLLLKVHRIIIRNL